VSRRRVRLLSLEQVQPPSEPADDRARRQQPDPRCRQLEREWKTVEPDTELCNIVGVRRRQLEIPARTARPLDEEPYRLEPPEPVERDAPGELGKLERWDRIDTLSGQPERSPARDEKRGILHLLDQLGKDRRSGEHLLEVVEHEQRLPTAQERHESLDDVSAGALEQTQTLCDRGRDELGIGDRCEVDHNHAVPEVRSQLGHELEGEPRLSGSPRAGERHETRLRRTQETREVPALTLATDERGRIVVGRGRRALGRAGLDMPGRAGAEPVVLPENRLLQLPQCGSRLDAELLDEEVSRPAVDLERVGLASRPVEREHELPPQTFSQRVGGDQRLQLLDQLTAGRESQVGVDALLERLQAELDEPRDLLHCRRLVLDVTERASAP
jgi:hypothetical protein